MKSESSELEQSSLISHDLALVEKENFSISVPSSCKEIVKSGDNASLWQFRDDELTIDIELGVYAPSARVEEAHSSITESEIEVDGAPRKVVHFTMVREAAILAEPERPYFTMMSFDDLDNPFYNFSIRIAYRQEGGRVLAIRIIESLKLRGELELRDRARRSASPGSSPMLPGL